MVKREYLVQLMLIFGIMMVILIIMFAFYILYSPSFDYLHKYLRVVFAVLLISYGFYRSVNIFRKFKNRED